MLLSERILMIAMQKSNIFFIGPVLYSCQGIRVSIILHVVNHSKKLVSLKG